MLRVRPGTGRERREALVEEWYREQLKEAVPSEVPANSSGFAATGQTAAKLISARADHTKPNMGLTSWKGAAVRKADVTIAKSYLREEEISELNRIVVMWLDYAEDQAKRRKQVFLRDWESKLNDFLAFNDRRVLPNAGKISKEEADARADAEYEEFAARRRTYLEAEAESAAFRSLEEQTKQVSPENGRTPRKRSL